MDSEGQFGALIFLGVYSAILTILLLCIGLYFIRRKKRSKGEINPRSKDRVSYHDNKSFEQDDYRRNDRIAGGILVNGNSRKAISRKLSRGEESLNSFKSAIDNYHEEFASVRSDSFRSLYDDSIETHSPVQSLKCYSGKEFLETLNEDARKISSIEKPLRKKNPAPSLPLETKASSDNIAKEPAPTTEVVTLSKARYSEISFSSGKEVEIRGEDFEPVRPDEEEPNPKIYQIQKDVSSSNVERSEISIAEELSNQFDNVCSSRPNVSEDVVDKRKLLDEIKPSNHKVLVETDDSSSLSTIDNDEFSDRIHFCKPSEIMWDVALTDEMTFPQIPVAFETEETKSSSSTGSDEEEPSSPMPVRAIQKSRSGRVAPVPPTIQEVSVEEDSDCESHLCTSPTLHISLKSECSSNSSEVLVLGQCVRVEDSSESSGSNEIFAPPQPMPIFSDQRRLSTERKLKRSRSLDSSTSSESDKSYEIRVDPVVELKGSLKESWFERNLIEASPIFKNINPGYRAVYATSKPEEAGLRRSASSELA